MRMFLQKLKTWFSGPSIYDEAAKLDETIKQLRLRVDELRAQTENMLRKGGATK